MKTKGFTLVEILIVVVILGVLAAIVIPTFSQASTDSNLTNLRANIQTIRTQIQLYKVHHDELLPGQTTAGGNVTDAGFVAALLATDGNSDGPYITQMPVNRYIQNPAQNRSITCVNNASASAAGTEGTAWWFNAATGEFRACDSVANTQW
ncbi:MAG: type II secretion system protein [Anaerohalosphaera sp.]|nr:type II secretion system protein [Anaerohalosphaera sp.]